MTEKDFADQMFILKDIEKKKSFSFLLNDDVEERKEEKGERESME